MSDEEIGGDGAGKGEVIFLGATEISKDTLGLLPLKLSRRWTDGAHVANEEANFDKENGASPFCAIL